MPAQDLPVAATVVMVRDGAGGPEVLMIERPDRGSFAGAWVFPGGKVEPGDAVADGESEEDIARRAGVREALEETGLALDTGALATLSVWVPPRNVTVRIRTWFFAAPAPEGSLRLSEDEAVDAAWLRPADALARHSRREMTLVPPTWVTLNAMTAAQDADGFVAGTRLAGVERFETAWSADRQVLMWEGDADYDAAPAASHRRHRLEIGALPWVYTRTG